MDFEWHIQENSDQAPIFDVLLDFSPQGPKRLDFLHFISLKLCPIIEVARLLFESVFCHFLNLLIEGDDLVIVGVVELLFHVAELLLFLVHVIH